MVKNFSLVLALLIGFSAILPAADDPAKGHYESALFFFQNQKIQQALEDLNLIIKSFPQSPYADDALLRLGTYYYQDKKPDQALGYFQQIRDRYADSDSAPAAYYYIGEIYLSRLDPASLEEALADFQRVTRVYPSSSWVDRSLVGAGLVLKLRGEFEKAYEEFARVKTRYPGSSVAPLAQFEVGVCSVFGNQMKDAATAFQKVIQRFPDSEYATRAVEMNTLLYRLYLAPQTDKKIYAPDTSFRLYLGMLDEPSGMAIDSKQNVYVCDKGKKSVSTYDPKGTMFSSFVMALPYFIFVDSQDHNLIANDTGAVLDGKETISFTNPTGKQEPLEEIRSIAADQAGKYYVVSNKLPGIYVYDQKKVLVTSIGSPATTEKEFYKVIINSRNQICALDKERKQITIYGPDGKVLNRIGPTGKGYAFDKIEDFAVDRANHIYALEKNPHSILIFSPAGELMRYILSLKKTVLDFDDAKLIAVGPSGAVYLLDKDKKQVLKLG